MREEYLRSGDNTWAVAEGLERTGRLVTSAAAIMVVVFASFGLASVVVVKALGVSLGLAIALDATLVRCLIVPATMRLFGDWNWWAPRWLGGAANIPVTKLPAKPQLNTDPAA
jgi:RND superfamily putative drug exporter